jgi:hypothetical protein
MAYASVLQISWIEIAQLWILTVIVSVTLAAVALAIISGSFWLAGLCAAKIVPTVDENGSRLRGKAAWRHVRYRTRVLFGLVSFFPFRPDSSWKGAIKVHFVIMTLMCCQEVTGVLLNEGNPRPLHLSLLAFFLPSVLWFSAGMLTAPGSAKSGYAKRQGSGPSLRRRYFSDEEIADRLRNERKHRETMKRYWERQHER